MTALEQPSQVMSTKNSCFWREKRQSRGQGEHRWKFSLSTPHLPFSLGRFKGSQVKKVHTDITKGSSAKLRTPGAPPYHVLVLPLQHNPEGPLEIVWLPQSQHKWPSPWPLLDLLSLSRGHKEKQISCLQLLAVLTLSL